MNAVREVPQWWQQSDQFDWLSAYVKGGGLETTWRAATASFTALLAALPIVLLLSPAGPNHTLTVAISIVAAACSGAGALLWLTRWPTRTQSALFALVSSSSIAATCLAQADPYLGLMGCTGFAVIGGYIAYFHNARYVALNFAVAAVSSAILSFRLIATTGDLALAGSALVIVVLLNIGVPFGILSLVQALRLDLRRSDLDPLTGLLNRRTFYHSANELLMRPAHTEENYLIVVMIDLDNFKQLNDTRGHAVGDAALVSVGAVLRGNCGPEAVIGRVGGEEFLIADTHSAARPVAMAERLRQAVDDLPYSITASIGTASASLKSATPKANRQLLDRLIRTSDAAMYDAKRAGGNQICHRSDVAPSNSV